MSSATPEQKKAIAGYFQDHVGFTESASPYVIDLGIERVESQIAAYHAWLGGGGWVEPPFV